jgi:hypothetical protein
MADTPIIINGIPMPFNADELMRVLAIVKKSLSQAEEGFSHEDERKVLDQLLENLKQIS